MKQQTAIRRALELKGWYGSIYRRGPRWYGKIKDEAHIIGYHSDFRTADHEGHSTRVYLRDNLVATVYGTVTI